MTETLEQIALRIAEEIMQEIPYPNINLDVAIEFAKRLVEVLGSQSLLSIATSFTILSLAYLCGDCSRRTTFNPLSKHNRYTQHRNWEKLNDRML